MTVEVDQNMDPILEGINIFRNQSMYACACLCACVHAFIYACAREHAWVSERNFDLSLSDCAYMCALVCVCEFACMRACVRLNVVGCLDWSDFGRVHACEQAASKCSNEL